MKSILQEDRERCYLCGMYGTSLDPLDEHHVFFGTANRKKSEKYGLKVYLHHNKCHIFGDDAVHKNASVCRSIYREAQEAAMRHYGWTTEEFIEKIGRNYIGD